MRQRIIIATAALAVAIGAAAGLWQWRSRAAVPALAAQQLAAAAQARPVDKTDRLIWDYQQRVRQSPGDVQAYAVLGAAYLQKARDTGDPTYYAKAQDAIDAALDRDPQSVEALIGAGVEPGSIRTERYGQ